MKKLIYLFLSMVLVFTTACDPMGDIYDDLDAEGSDPITGEIAFAMSDEDYEDLDLSYGNFNSIDQAKEMIPGLLTDKYPVWGIGSLADVTFKWYNPVGTYSADVYALSDDDHNAITGNTYGNFDDEDHIYEYLEANYPNPEEEDFVSLRYRFWDGGESTLTDGFAFEDGEWTKFTGFTEEQYEAMGEGYPNFSSHDEADVKIPVSLLDVFKFDPKSAGDIVLAMYELYVGGGVTKSYTSAYIFDGMNFAKYENEAYETIKFGHDGTVWVPDNTIKYTLTSADFTLIGDALIDTYPGPAGSASNYGNFDRREGNANYWSDAMIVEGLGILLDDMHPSAEEGQKYTMSYAIYNGASGTETSNVIKTDGVWVAN